MSEDPYEGTTGNIMTQNRYAYAENDPVNKRDPGGHMALLKKIKRTARRVAKKVVKTVKTVASRIKSSVRGAPKKIASAVKSASNYSRASAKATLGYVRTKYKSAEQRAKDIRKTLKAQYNSLRKKVSCGIKKSATGVKVSCDCKKVSDGTLLIGHLTGGSGMSLKEESKLVLKNYNKEYSATKKSLEEIRKVTNNSRAGTGKLSWITRNKNIKLEKISSATSKLGKANVAITIANSGLDVYSEYKDDIRKGVSKKRANINLGVNIAFEAGEAATGAAGAVAGAKLGAVIGSFVPGAGTVVGAVAGTVIGAGVSFVAGKSFENIIEDKYKQDVQNYVYNLNK